MENRSDAAESRSQQDGRNPFEKFVEATYDQVSRARFFTICLAIVLVWAASYPFWSSTKSWELAIHTFTSVLSLLLLALLENAGRRSEEAAHEKLNVLAEALAALMDAGAASDPELERAARNLRDAVGLEARH